MSAGFAPLRYEPYETTVDVPNVVVDGSPNAGTVLTLTHWPGYAAPPGLAADLSAQMAFRYLDRIDAGGASLHGAAEVVTTNHFDQDGLVGTYALVHPADARARRTLLEDVAAAGDFAVYRDRRAARLSMALAAYAMPDRSPLDVPADDGDVCALLYTELLGRLPELIDGLDDHRDLWEDEDRLLSQGEEALATGQVTIEEHRDVDLAVVTVSEAVPSWSGHRFGFASRGIGIHPMALHAATDRSALLVVRGRRYDVSYRYETWVQYRSWRPRLRVELSGLAAELTALETGGATWTADPIGGLTPQLHIPDDAESSLDVALVRDHVIRHLRQEPPAWNPYPDEPADAVDPGEPAEPPEAAGDAEPVWSAASGDPAEAPEAAEPTGSAANAEATGGR